MQNLEPRFPCDSLLPWKSIDDLRAYQESAHRLLGKKFDLYGVAGIETLEATRGAHAARWRTNEQGEASGLTEFSIRTQTGFIHIRASRGVSEGAFYVESMRERKSFGQWKEKGGSIHVDTDWARVRADVTKLAIQSARSEGIFIDELKPEIDDAFFAAVGRLQPQLVANLNKPKHVYLEEKKMGSTEELNQLDEQVKNLHMQADYAERKAAAAHYLDDIEHYRKEALNYRFRAKELMRTRSPAQQVDDNLKRPGAEVFNYEAIPDARYQSVVEAHQEDLASWSKKLELRDKQLAIAHKQLREAEEAGRLQCRAFAKLEGDLGKVETAIGSIAYKEIVEGRKTKVELLPSPAHSPIGNWRGPVR